ncbi:CD109 antigen-like isoform X2 [Mya arenaria]|uniref:CD109 antigen-like isoform X2 n=1 Tax=Mya arenaria TaxID=6604 RepID=UPI0022E61FBB|nr:CD109 antigen-like isoform X2 [Mya arenaria]
MSWLSLISIAVMVTGAVAKNSYVMLFPRTIRSNDPLKVVVHFLTPVAGETVTAELTTWENETISSTVYTIPPARVTRSIRKKHQANYKAREERERGSEKRRLHEEKERPSKKDDVPPVAVPVGVKGPGADPKPLSLPDPVGLPSLPPVGPFPPVTPRTVLTNTQTTVDSPTSDIILELKVPSDISWGSYRVKVEGVGSLNFKNETTVNGNPRSIAIFIQTDKANYKPGDSVSFRVFAVDKDKKLKAGTMDIEIRDPKNNKIFELTNEDNMQLGGIKGTMPLSDMPPLGRFTISAEMVGTESSKENYNFEVKEYVLPKFEVKVNLPASGKTTDTSLKGNVEAKYTFGKPVLGPVVLQLRKRYSSGFFDAKAVQSETTLGADGTVAFEIPMEMIKRVTRSLRYETLVLAANVTEALTGITETGEAEIRFYENPYKIEFFPNMPDNFKPGFGPYPMMIRVTDQDGRPPALPTQQVLVTVTFFTDKPVQGPQNTGATGFDVISPFILGDTILEATMPFSLIPTGIVTYDLPVPVNTATFSIKAEFAGESVYKDVRRFRSPSDVFLKVTMDNTAGLTIGTPVKVSFTSNASPPEVRYMVQAKGAIVATGKARYSDGSFNIALSTAMAPSARIVVYFVQPDGEIVADGLNFVVDDTFDNKVTIAFDQVSSNTKTTVNLKVTADANSMVHVLAVDKSVLLLGDGNDITPGRVEDKMRQFGDIPWVVRGWGIIPPWSFDRADDAKDIFDNSELKVLTDANLYSFDLWRLEQQQLMKSRSEAFSGSSLGFTSGGSVTAGQQGETRTEFPETWIWQSAPAINGEAIFSATTPDSITEWAANAFAINADTGLGVAPLRSNLTVFKPFFVNLQLPYSVTRGENAVIQANVFNYRETGANPFAVVRLLESPQYEILSVDGSGASTVISGPQEKCVQTIEGNAVSVFFNIRPLVVGDLDVNVRVTLPPPINLYDEVIRKLPTKAEGVPKTKNQPVLISIDPAGMVTEERDVVYPQGKVEDSEKIRVTVIGDIFGSTFENLENMIQMPSGCGEQNMIKFAPGVFAARYLQNTLRWDNKPELQEQIRTTLLTGYQRQLIYQRSDGSFSAFGEADNAGSLWLTAFVVKSFSQANQLGLISIDSDVVDRAVRFMKNQQTPDGDFTEPGTVIHRALQGGTASTIRALTAFGLIALKEVNKAEILKNDATKAILAGAISSASSYLVNSIGQMTTDYERAISAYAIYPLAQHNSILTQLEQSANRVTEGNNIYWKNDSSSLSVETTAYALLTYSTRDSGQGDRDNGFKILLWLAKQRNPYGGFVSTQDTVVALQALTEYASLVYTDNVALSVTVNTRTRSADNTLVDGPPVTITLNRENHDVLQYIDFDGSVNQVVIKASGTGLALVEINQFFNVRSEETVAKYILSVTSSEVTATSYSVQVCASYNIVGSKSGMALLDIGMLSGFEAKFDEITVISGTFKRKERSGTRVIIYFDEIGSDNVCVTVPTQRVAFVANLKPFSVLAYSYYEPSERAMVEHIPSGLQPNLCSTCNGCCGEGNTVQLSSCGL